MEPIEHERVGHRDRRGDQRAKSINGRTRQAVATALNTALFECTHLPGQSPTSPKQEIPKRGPVFRAKSLAAVETDQPARAPRHTHPSDGLCPALTAVKDVRGPTSLRRTRRRRDR